MSATVPDAWLADLERRHFAELSFPEVRKGLQALSSLYVERRGRIGAGAAFDGAGKRAAFALFFGPLHFLVVREVVEAVGAAAPPLARVLDLGCGTGRNLPLFDAQVRAVGLDPCLETLRAARRRSPATPLVLAVAERLPFRAGSFDTVVSGLVFCSVAEPVRALGEVRRVLAPGGTLRMLEHVRATVSFHARLQDAFQPLWTHVTGGCHPNRDTEATVRKARFRIDEGSRRANGILRRFVASP